MADHRTTKDKNKDNLAYGLGGCLIGGGIGLIALVVIVILLILGGLHVFIDTFLDA